MKAESSEPVAAEPRSPDLFAELFALLTPERLLRDPRATGEGISVCVIDSGIDEAVVADRARLRGNESKPISGAIFTSDRSEPLPYEGKQSAPHGTTVADIILTLAPRVQLYSADVFGTRGACDVETLQRALHHAIHVWGCKVVNMSLGVAEQRLHQLPRRLQFQRIIEEAYFKDVLIFAAAHNEHPLTRSYPALFGPPLISVDRWLFEDPLLFNYSLNEQIEFLAHGKGYFGPFAQETATSWATPHLTGIAARILSLRPTLKPFEMKTILYWLSHQGPCRDREQGGE